MVERLLFGNKEAAKMLENLCRAELTELERANHLKRRKELFETRKKTGGKNSPTSLADGRKSGPQHGKAFDADTADKTGMVKSTVRRSRTRAEKIPDDVKEAITGTDAADKGVELDALSSARASFACIII